MKKLLMLFLSFFLLLNNSLYLKAEELITSDYVNDDEDGDGIHVNKYAINNNDGTYTITLEQYTDGNVSTVSKDIDIVMALDVSSSMYKEGYDYVYSDELDTSKAYVTIYDGSYYYVTYCNSCKRWYISGDANSNHAYYEARGLYHQYRSKWITPCSEYGDGGSQLYEYRILVNNIGELKKAATNFIDTLKKSGEEKGVEYKVALVKFADGLYSPYDQIGDDSYEYAVSSSLTNVNYTQIVSGFEKLEQSSEDLKTKINALEAKGMTRIDNSMYLARYLFSEDHDQCQRYVVFFTDGVPENDSLTEGDLFNTWDETDYQVANDALAIAKDMKENGTTIYTIGLRDDADASLPLTSSSLENNRFLHFLSSNYQNATSMDNPGELSIDSTKENYYSSTLKAAELTSIFENVADEIIAKPTTSLGSNSVIIDHLSKYFTYIPDTLESYTQDYDGTNFVEEKKAVDIDLKSITMQNDGSTLIKFTGYDFDANYVSSTARNGNDYGRKLILRFKVKPKNDFIGGNNVYTNLADSGIYDALEERQLAAYPEPRVNVDLCEFVVKLVDKNIYITGSLTVEQLLAESEEYYLSRDKNTYYQLQFDESGQVVLDYQDDFVTITSQLQNDSGQLLQAEDYAKLKQDKNYSLKLVVSNLYEAANQNGGKLLSPNREPGKANTDLAIETKATVYVYKPVLSFKDSEVYYGEQVASSFFEKNDYEVEKTFYRNATMGLASQNILLNAQPNLSIEYYPDTSKFRNNLVHSNDDIAVAISVSADGEDISDEVETIHTDCNEADTLAWPDCGWTEQNQAVKFLLHVKINYELPKTGNRDYRFLALLLIGIGIIELERRKKKQ